MHTIIKHQPTLHPVSCRLNPTDTKMLCDPQPIRAPPDVLLNPSVFLSFLFQCQYKYYFHPFSYKGFNGIKIKTPVTLN